MTSNQQIQQNISEINTDYTSPINSPPVPPRRKSQDKFKLDNKDNKENISNKGKNQQENIKVNRLILLLLLFIFFVFLFF